MNVSEVMSTAVVTVPPEATLREVAPLLVAYGISGVPVVDDEQHVLGVVSETDILARRSGGAPARTAAEAMTAPAIIVSRDTPVGEAASTLVERRIDRLPVVERGRLVGIVTRADLVDAFARTDEELRLEVKRALAGAFMWCSPGYVHVHAVDGDVLLTGRVESDDVAWMVEEAAKRVLGVLSVRSELEVLGTETEDA
jgi:CBS domain-containing protein